MKSISFITLQGVSKAYQEGGSKRPVLVNANASFSKGELIAVVGKSGSGKSTFLNLISGIDLVDSGKIMVGNLDLTALDENGRTLFRRQNIGFIFQFFNLINTLSVLENVLLPLELNNINGNESKIIAMDMLSAVGLEDRASTFPDKLSGGEQQRVAIARALVHNPGLVLADEPTGNLDEETSHQILTLLDKLTRQSGKNLIMVTHSHDAAAMADRILCLREGELTPQCEP